jgi:transcriptional regulator with XRE-family HTH domain
VVPKDVNQLIEDLTAWCNAEYGRQAELAKKLGVSKQFVSHWINRRKTPSLYNFFKIRGFLQKQKGRQKNDR